MDILTYALAKSYIDKALLGVGALKGAPCTIKSQTETDDSYIITFEWTDTSGASQTSELTIKKPEDGFSPTITENENNTDIFEKILNEIRTGTGERYNNI